MPEGETRADAEIHGEAPGGDVGTPAAIVLKAAGARDDRTRLGLALVVFMRVTAAIWIVQGLMQWGRC